MRLALAGACGSDETLPGTSHLHSASLDQITDLLASRTDCGALTPIANTSPVVTVDTDTAVIPRQTAFLLQGSAQDAEDQQDLRYSWEQIDLAGQGSSLADGDLGDVPLFRVFDPDPSPVRTFPRAPLNPVAGEILPTTNRTLSFRLQVSDQNSIGGAYSSAVTSLTVDAGAGPFAQTTANPSWVTGTETVSWMVNNTNQPPVSCANVDITVSLDGGATFDTVLALATANDGSEVVDVPAVLASDAVLRVKCSTNVFFSDFALAIDGTQCSVTEDCDDGNVCNGTETCMGIECVPGTPLSCDDGQFCNGVETCEPVMGCLEGTAPEFDDGNECTTDSCDEEND
ncbi:MAG: hypothetical protein AAFQ82_28155, partial [Myxococcota bacterium]